MSQASERIDRRQFITGLGASVAAGHLAMASLAAMPDMSGPTLPDYKPAAPLPLKIQPVLTVGLSQRREKTSWRGWGGFHTQDDIDKEQKRIKKELDKLASDCEFKIEVLPLITLNDKAKAAEVVKGDHDVLLMYAATSWGEILETLTDPKKWTIIFLRHKSGPVYLWYEIIHNRYLRKTVDQFGQPGIDHRDIVVDSPDELKWRFRALYGLKNTLGKKIVCIGGAGGWGQGGQKAPECTENIFKMDLQEVKYPALEEMIKQARGNSGLVKRCKQQAKKYLQAKGVSLETKTEFVENAFVLTEVFKALMHEAKTDALTVNWCMGTIMGMSETTACLPLCLLNDTGYNVYCESDFVVIPSGVLLHYISSLPVFLNDPTYPHDGVVTIAHCTAPRKMNGKDLEPVRVLTHFESDFGASPKVEMKLGQKITVIDPDFDFKKWVGFDAEIIDNPFLDICRSQIDIKMNCSTDALNAETKGFHWMACYGDYLKETGYALKKVGIEFLNLSA